MFRLRGCPEDDTIFFAYSCIASSDVSAVSVLVTLGRFFLAVFGMCSGRV